MSILIPPTPTEKKSKGAKLLEKLTLQDLIDVESLAIDKMETVNKDRVEPNPNNHIIPKHPARVIINGKSGSGKTNLIINLLTKPQFYGGYFNAIFLFSHTYHTDDIWQNLNLPDQMVFDKFSDKAIKDILEYQQKFIDKGEDTPKILFLFDDIIDDQRYYRSAALKKLFTQSRHYNASLWFSTQEYKAVYPTFRKQISDLIFFVPDNQAELEAICKEQNISGLKTRDFERFIMNLFDKKYVFCVIRKTDRKILKNFDEFVTPRVQ